jgi:hypothetical protein
MRFRTICGKGKMEEADERTECNFVERNEQKLLSGIQWLSIVSASDESTWLSLCEARGTNETCRKDRRKMQRRIMKNFPKALPQSDLTDIKHKSTRVHNQEGSQKGRI